MSIAPNELVQPEAAVKVRVDDGHRLVISLATYNEVENLRPLVETIREYAPRATILVVDDNSPDGTGRLADEIRAELTDVHVIHRSGKQNRPKTAIKGKRYLCGKCRKRSPKPVKTPAPWYCPRCLARDVAETPQGESE